MDKIL
jgi:T-complex protein 1 subunit beta